VEVPLLTQLHERFSNKGFVLISVSIDQDLQAMRDAIKRRAMTWIQIGDGKGPETEVARLFNPGAGTHFVIDCDGKIAGSHEGAHGVAAMARLVENLMAERANR
jgi:hypothetical protein